MFYFVQYLLFIKISILYLLQIRFVQLFALSHLVATIFSAYLIMHKLFHGQVNRNFTDLERISSFCSLLYIIYFKYFQSISFVFDFKVHWNRFQTLLDPVMRSKKSNAILNTYYILIIHNNTIVESWQKIDMLS